MLLRPSCALTSSSARRAVRPRARSGSSPIAARDRRRSQPSAAATPRAPACSACNWRSSHSIPIGMADTPSAPGRTPVQRLAPAFALTSTSLPSPRLCSVAGRMPTPVATSRARAGPRARSWRRHSHQANTGARISRLGRPSAATPSSRPAAPARTGRGSPATRSNSARVVRNVVSGSATSWNSRKGSTGNSAAITPPSSPTRGEKSRRPRREDQHAGAGAQDRLQRVHRLGARAEEVVDESQHVRIERRLEVDAGQELAVLADRLGPEMERRGIDHGHVEERRAVIEPGVEEHGTPGPRPPRSPRHAGERAPQDDPPAERRRRPAPSSRALSAPRPRPG